MSEYPEVHIRPGGTSYFSDPQATLDPYLFDEEGRMHEDIRLELASLIYGFMSGQFVGVEEWMNAWIAGSGISFQWNAFDGLGDLDVLIGIDFTKFRASNPTWGGLGDGEISREINQRLYDHLNMDEWRGLWEVTFYVNLDAYDIRAINPYAAYDLIHDEWTVEPSREGAPKNKYWDEASKRDHANANTLVDRYSSALTALRGATNPAGRVNAERALEQTIDQAVAMFDDIRHGRKSAFSRVGAGYKDWGNYRWQAGKGSGVIPALRVLKKYRDDVTKSKQAQTYGLEIPDTDTLIGRAVTARRFQ